LRPLGRSLYEASTNQEDPMHGTTFRRLVLVTMLVGALGLATQATAFADAPARRHVAAVDKKKKKKPTVKVADSSLGEILVDGKGNTVYMFDSDTDTENSACTGGCSGTWPPVEAKKAKPGKGLDASLLLVNSSGQVSYNGHLLYLFAGDSAPGDTNGDGVGGVWHAIGADGNPLS
jgi:predicted lipoprotein with Yx(FWY)xxD motif